MVQLHCLLSLDGTNFWQQLSGKATRLRIFFNQHLLLQMVVQVISRVCHSSVFQLPHAPKYYGPYIVGAAGAAAQSVVNTAAAGAARGGRNAELQWKDKHSDNAFRLGPGHCHHLSNPNVLIAYNKWATNQSTRRRLLPGPFTMS